MKPFKYLSPTTVEKAISYYGEHSETAKFIAGGTDVIVKVKEGWMEPDYLISLKKIEEMGELHKNEATGELSIGALVTHATLEKSLMIQNEYPIIYDAVSNIGSLQVRNVGTIGGNLINAVPSADGAIPLIALDGVALLHGPSGERSAQVKDLFIAPYKTILKSGEILKKITIPTQAPNTGSAYIKFGRRAAMELPLIGIGVLLTLEDDMETCSKARICLGVAAPTPMRAFDAEKLLIGKKINKEILIEAGNIAADESKVRNSIRGKAWHRKEMIRVHVKRMGLKCLEIIKNNS
ncbi:MAG: xanthine dehydrogenase family protein subunit M [Desulfobacula sp.]|uniref:FAD binding domain-containing protein n=1 Tax=Desulfobacula sp. TaxID=2593537 RepID=UPI001D67F7ED|nr:xanthine dehydrogenase family protein subunit M [Desulfobacula sp.]MBT3486663.1 xanthine dehydrogenase family protein subunit M [Desulfobacula sp.]MBT3804893.1 xanthine dehydrogenase family protein subunit M [Desulfobacula sp.]MBT4026656.1 xanthine dehydrogenase family protein subunit M [Desulfobacula sp.]MBT4200494.1 xanthine dehydrogenase family protein subunit M [Desulfobacula sp.]